MSRYKEAVAPTEEVSQEGFFSSVGKFLAAVGSSISRANSLSYIDFEPDARPEVNGQPKKDYSLLLTSIKNAIGSGEPWDLTIVAKQYEYHDTGFKVGDNPLTEKVRIKKRTVAVFLGEGRNVKVRLPGYQDGDGSAIVTLLLIEDLNLKRIE